MVSNCTARVLSQLTVYSDLGRRSCEKLLPRPLLAVWVFVIVSMLSAHIDRVHSGLSLSKIFLFPCVFLVRCMTGRAIRYATQRFEYGGRYIAQSMLDPIPASRKDQDQRSVILCSDVTRWTIFLSCPKRYERMKQKSRIMGISKSSKPREKGLSIFT